VSGKPAIAIDGPAASGKGTIARRLAERLGYAYLDTGTLYRAVALATRLSGHAPDDAAAAAHIAETLEATALAALVGDPALRAAETAQGASIVAAMPAVRAALLQFQRDFAAKPPEWAAGAILDGRDIGTVVLPDAPAKLFITASPEIRAERRWKELRANGATITYPAVLEELRQRDARDSGRAVAPMKPASDAVIVETSALTIDQAVEQALAAIAEAIGRPG
jgi:cytidylate kinase